MNYHYFVSYYYKGRNGVTGFGSTDFIVSREIDNMEIIGEIQRQLVSNLALEAACVLNYILLRVENDGGEA